MSNLGVAGDTVEPWDGRCEDPSLIMFRKAVEYALARGLTWDLLPELRSENGVLHSFPLRGKKIKLADAPGWEERSGYASLIDEIRTAHRSTGLEEMIEPVLRRSTAKV